MSEPNKNLNFIMSKKISLKNHAKYREAWLQDIINDNPELLGLGELEVIKKERLQSSGGRIDFLLRDNDSETLYEVEIQLGKTDPSHIIRTIEYWDIERRRNPNYDHRAVIVAEEITNRFFNVISLMNRSIPIIAIQLNALQIEDKLTLDFTKVLDIYEIPEDEIESAEETVDRNYWEKKASSKALELTDKLINLIKTINPNIKWKYNQSHLAIGTEIRNCIWLRPRKSDFVNVDIKINDDEAENITNKLNEMGLMPRRKNDRAETIVLAFPMKNKNLVDNGEIVSEIFSEIIRMSS